jgi:hypothetical protein
MTAQDSSCDDMHAATLSTLRAVTELRQCNSGECQVETTALCFSCAPEGCESIGGRHQGPQLAKPFPPALLSMGEGI